MIGYGSFWLCLMKPVSEESWDFMPGYCTKPSYDKDHWFEDSIMQTGDVKSLSKYHQKYGSFIGVRIHKRNYYVVKRKYRYHCDLLPFGSAVCHPFTSVGISPLLWQGFS